MAEQKPLSESERAVLLSLLKRLFATVKDTALKNHAKGIIIRKTLLN